MMGLELLEVEPRELKFVVESKKSSSCLVQLINNSNNYVAFKVKTTNPKKYCVRPNMGIVLPNAAYEFTVTLQPQRAAPLDMQCRDRFLVQSTAIPYGTKEEEMKPEFFSKEDGRYIEDCKLRVVFVSPSDAPSLLQVNESFNREVSFKESHFQTLNRNESTIPVESPLCNPDGLVPNTIYEHTVLNEVPSTEETAVQNGDELKGVKEVELKLHNFQSQLNETEKINSTLEEEKKLITKEKEELQSELVIMRKKKVHVGYPDLFVVFIGIVGLVFGYILHG